MKKILFLISGIVIFNQVFANPEMLVCPREEEIIQKIKENPNCSADKFLELSAKNVFEVELGYFDQEIVNKILRDNVSNPNWLSKKGIYELRLHKLCLEKSCQIMLNECDTNKNFKENNYQSTWCKKTAENIWEIDKTKIKTAVLENQRRKTRGAFREKFRALEVRANQYFVPNLISFIKEFKRFTDKITAFIYNPLQ